MNWSACNARRGGLRRWLQAPGSLSARQAATGQHFTVQVLNQGREPLSVDEAYALGMPGQRLGYAREVVLRVDGVPLVFARSVTTHADSLGAWRSLRGLGSRPLADVLFRCVGITRQALEFASLLRQVCTRGLGATGEDAAQAAFPARRSVFVRRRAALLVMEVFAAPVVHWVWSEKVSNVKTTRRGRV
jgi:chorismate--pyruvate lyase